MFVSGDIVYLLVRKMVGFLDFLVGFSILCWKGIGLII